MPTASDVITTIESSGFEALVSKGVKAILFRMKMTTNGPSADKTVNLLKGYAVGTWNKGEESRDTEEFQEQISGGLYKQFIGGAVDGGDFTLSTYFAKKDGKPPLISGVNPSLVLTPEFILILALPVITDGAISTTTMEGFFMSGVVYSGGGDIKGDLGKIIGSSLKFKISGEPKLGTDNVGSVPMAWYNGTTD